MDPDVALETIRRNATWLIEHGAVAHRANIQSVADELAEHMQALDEWIKRGGALPRQWQQSKED